jgi:site-specific DNA-methyltransferase (adenine-specific)
MSDITLWQGDCLERQHDIPESSIDVVLTDPPFSSGTRKEGQKSVRKSMLRATEDDEWFATDCLTTNGFVWLMRQNALRWKRLLKKGGHVLVFIDWRMSANLAAAIESADFRYVGMLVWDKTYFGMGACFRNQYELILHFTNGRGREPQRRDMGNVLSHPPIRDGSHPNEKPVPLLKDLLSVVAPPGGRILDPFMGTGSVGVAAAHLEMDFIGIDLEPQYVDVARDRIEREPGRRPGQPSLFSFGAAS